jgi:serine/threonine-protein kinase RsbW
MSSFEDSAEEFEIEIPSEPAAGREVQDRIIGLLESYRFQEHDVFGVRLALEEALVNAIKHGNRMDPDKTVRIACLVSNHKVRVEIEDQGCGFVPEEVPDPTADENLERPCGRGIMLMRAFMTLIEYNTVGNRVVLEKHRSANADGNGAAEGECGEGSNETPDQASGGAEEIAREG